MPRASRSGLMVLAITVSAVIAGPVAGAQASNASIVKTLDAAGPKIDRDEAKVLDGLADLQKGRPAPLVRALRSEVTELHALKTAVAGESASTPAGVKGRTDVLAGLAKISTAYAALATEVAHETTGKPVTKADVKATIALDERGRKDLTAGVKLLS